METPAGPTTPLEKDSVSWGTIILWPLAALFIYVFSVGPVDTLFRHGHFRSPAARKTISIVYAPLIWADRHTFLRKPLEAYLDLWQRLPNGK